MTEVDHLGAALGSLFGQAVDDQLVGAAESILVTQDVMGTRGAEAGCQRT